MKRFTSLIAIAVCLVIGGVYAAWSYAQGSVTFEQAITPEMTGVSTTPKEKGTLEMTTISYVIDDANNDHIAEFSIPNDIVITFTPAKGADENVALYGIQFQIVFTAVPNDASGEWKYDAKDVFTTNEEPLVSPVLTEDDVSANPDANEHTKTADDGSGTVGTVTRIQTTDGYKFTWTIPASAAMGKINLYGGDTLSLPTRADYEAFKVELVKGKIKAVVSENGVA